ncbi:phage tail terminator protein [Paenibacillus sp. USDA918EY]|uniref:phage tail terminator protein n=1 Tax=Paenibacillus sp. USDA918EY TaxID=2689575 RepID=UPI00191736BD|nr:minor capsid protein [Paenibacillus sp. USDA918EY]
MITLAQVRDWIKTQVACPQWYIGKIDAKKEQCIVLYNTTGAPVRLAVGGIDATGYQVKAVSILVHWGRNADVAEIKAQEVYDALFGQTAEIGGKRIVQFRMVTPQPISVGTDSEGIYEYVIETHIYHER